MQASYITPRLVLMVLAFVLLVLASINVGAPRVSLFPLGMALWLLALMLPGPS